MCVNSLYTIVLLCPPLFVSILLGFKIAVEKYFDADLKVRLKVLLEGNLRLFVLSEVYTRWNGNYWYTYIHFFRIPKTTKMRTPRYLVNILGFLYQSQFIIKFREARFTVSENDYNEDSALSGKYSRFSLSITIYYKISRDRIYGLRKEAVRL